MGIVENIGNVGLPPALPAEQNERTYNLATTAVARYPRLWDGSDILAHNLMEEFADESSAARTGIGLRELARMRPDGEAIAERVAAIHAAFGIDYRPTPKELVDTVGSITSFAVSAVSAAVLRSVWVRKLPFYDSLASTSTVRRRFGFFGARVFRMSQIEALHEVLSTNEDVRMDVTQYLAGRAALVLAKSHDRQQGVVSSYHKTGTTHLSR